MTKEELKQEAKEYAGKYGKSNFDLWDTARFAYYQGAEPREKRIEELEKENERLTVSYETLKLHDEEEISLLQAQIEKMKCCFNCKHSRTEYEHCRTDKHEQWEIKEKNE